jgi:cytochrome P450
VRYHDQPTWLINGFDEVARAFSDEVHFQSAATYMIHGEPSMGRTLQTMSGREHSVNRGLVSGAFLPRIVRSYVESLIEPIANELLDAIEGMRRGRRDPRIQPPVSVSGHHPAVRDPRDRRAEAARLGAQADRLPVGSRRGRARTS